MSTVVKQSMNVLMIGVVNNTLQMGLQITSKHTTLAKDINKILILGQCKN